MQGNILDYLIQENTNSYSETCAAAEKEKKKEKKARIMHLLILSNSFHGSSCLMPSWLFPSLLKVDMKRIFDFGDAVGCSPLLRDLDAHAL